MTKQVIIPLPDRDFDTTEVSIPWKHFVEAGLHVTFSTETGQMGQTDPRLLTGVIFGQLGAKPDALVAYRELEKNEAFRHPIPYESIDPQEYDLLLLPGGHAKGMRQYLESKVVQHKALEFLKHNKVVGAICHGVLVLARAKCAVWEKAHGADQTPGTRWLLPDLLEIGRLLPNLS